MIYDYYYSEQHESHMKATYVMMGEKYFDTLINGMKYTEMIEQGKEPMTAHFPDIKKIYTGSDETIVVR